MEFAEKKIYVVNESTSPFKCDLHSTHQVFSVCKPILRRDTTTAMYLLPSILVCVLCEAQHHHSHVLDEVLAVMNHMQEKEDNSSKKEDSSAVLSSEFKLVGFSVL